MLMQMRNPEESSGSPQGTSALCKDAASEVPTGEDDPMNNVSSLKGKKKLESHVETRSSNN